MGGTGTEMERGTGYGNGLEMAAWEPSHMAPRDHQMISTDSSSYIPSSSSSSTAAAAPVPYTGPVYVNARQYARILKRRETKLIIDAKLKLNPPRKRYLHESRHNHACKRPRGTGGRFLTKAELDAMNSQGHGQQHREESNQFRSHNHDNELQSVSEENEDTETSHHGENIDQLVLQSLNSSEGEHTDHDEPNHEDRFDDVVSL